MEDNSDDLKRKQEWQAVKEKLALDLQKTLTEAQDVPEPGNPFIPGHDASSDTESNTNLYSILPQPPHYAGFWLRFLALVIDTLIFVLAGIILGFSVGTIGVSLKSLDIPLFIIGWLYYALMESSSKQATIGKIVLGISVVDTTGNRISFGRATGRYFAKIISGIILSIGYIMAAFTAKKQALHDILASTLVIKNQTD